MKKLKKQINSIEDCPKKQPFKVPDSYFENFEARLQTRLVADDTKQKEKMGNAIVRTLKPILWLAASFVLVLLLVKLPLKHFFPHYSVDNTQQEEYPIEIDLLDEMDFYNQLVSSDTFSSDSLKADEIYDYLLCEMTEYDLYAELNN